MRVMIMPSLKYVPLRFSAQVLDAAHHGDEIMRTRTILAVAALLAASVVAASAGADGDAKKDQKPKEPTAAQLKIA